jgi:hypothetical protein
MKLTCLCTANCLCLHCRDVLVLRAIAGRLFTAKDQERGSLLIDLAASMEKELRESLQARKPVLMGAFAF